MTLSLLPYPFSLQGRDRFRARNCEESPLRYCFGASAVAIMFYVRVCSCVPRIETVCELYIYLDIYLYLYP